LHTNWHRGTACKEEESLEKQYASYCEGLQHLMQKLGEAAPEAMSGFNAWHKGASCEKIAEAIGVAVLMRGRSPWCTGPRPWRRWSNSQAE